MSKTASLKKITPRTDTGNSFTLRDWILGLLAGMLPHDQLHEPGNAEAVYLQQYVFTDRDLPKNIFDIIEQSSSEEKNLIGLIGSEASGPIDVLVLTLCYLVETDPMIGRCVAFMQQPMGASRPTLSLLAAMIHDSDYSQGEFTGAVMSRIINGKAVQLGLLQVLNEGFPLPERPVRLHTPLVLNISDGQFSWPGTSNEMEDHDYDLPPSIAYTAKLQTEWLNEGSQNTLVIRSSSIKENKCAARNIAGYLKRQALFIEDQEKALTALGPVSVRKNLLPVFSYDCGPGEQVKIPGITGYHGPVLVLAGHEGAFETQQGRVTSWAIPLPTHEERTALWEKYLGNHELSSQLASDHIHGMDRIIELADLAKRQSLIRQKDSVGIEEIREAAWLRESKGLSSMAQPVKADVTDKTLIVRSRTQRQLELLAQRCRLREQLVDKLGITLQARYHMGVKVLFTGPSGTGKTLASSWLANRLGMPLYRVDLASITSKYIGETEKNLSQLLSQAEQEDVVLLFDEADSLFSKRTDVKDANDRFANSQTNYLLQRIESYSGVVLLTSNSKARFDSAFTRRLDMMIDFPLPSPEERRAIWLNHLGSFHTLSKGNINQLAVQCDLSGGHIRNVVLTAAVIAKSLKNRITFEAVIQALSDEYRKLGKQLVPELRKMMKKEQVKDLANIP